MNITVVGLGLIGGSICKALKKNTSHMVYGVDNNEETCKMALLENAVDKIMSDSKELSSSDLTIICLYPEAVVSFISENKDNFKNNSLVIDVCGVKEDIVYNATALLADRNVDFLGTHPMAGREYSGFSYSTCDLFNNSNYIITPIDEVKSKKSIDIVENFCNEIKVGRIIITTPENHDKMIAFTSQLAHIVSNAYVKSPEILNITGYTAGSYRDLTRVAKLNPDMWTTLFKHNRKNVINELNCIIGNLQEYLVALEDENYDDMRELLADGSKIKENSELL